MKNSVLLLFPVHEQIKPSIDTPEHVCNVCSAQYYTFCFSRCSRGVNDGYGVGIGDRRRRPRRGRRSKNLIKQSLNRSIWPKLSDSVPQSSVAATDDRRRTILHHGDEFRRSLARIERNHNQAFGHGGKVHRNPANAIVGIEGATLALLQSDAAQEGACTGYQSE